jgi:hypothetical protein
MGAFYSMEYALKLIISGNAIDSVKDKFEHEHYKKESFLTVMRILEKMQERNLLQINII